MKTAISFLPALFILIPGCAARTLFLDSDGGSTGESPATTTSVNGGSSSSSTSQTGSSSTGGPTSCTSSDCASYTLSCPHGTPTNVECVLDSSDQFYEPFCVLAGECSDTTGPTCSWTPPNPCSGSGSSEVCAMSVGGSGTVSVVVDPPVEAGASTTTLAAHFDSSTENPGPSFGDCVYQADGANLQQSGQVGVPAPSPGTITVTAAGFMATTIPACDGLYAPASFTQTIAPGALVSFAWSTPGDTPDGYNFPAAPPSVPAPHFVSIAASDALAAASPTVPRATDLAVDWTVTGTPLSMEQVVVALTQGMATVTCTFDATAGSGVVPADALLKLAAGSASYQVYSLHEADDGDTTDEWTLRFLVEMPAATPAGTAHGTLTLR